MSGHTEPEFGGVEESRFLEAYPLPWRAEVHPGMNRSSVTASDSTQVISGMNNAKAAFIAARVNSHADLVKALEIAQRWMVCDPEYDDEKQFDADSALVNAALATLTARKVG